MVGEIISHYRVIRPLGSGGMGEVYEAEDLALGRRVAIKTLPAAFAFDEKRRHRLALEAKAVAALNHPNIVTLYSVETVGDVHFIAMEVVDGRPLSVIIPRKGLVLPTILKLAAQIADALAAAHDRGITHRDIKPANIMVAADERVKILDFGLAKLKECEDTECATTGTHPVTAEGRIVGTVAYMSPEQAQGGEIDYRSDIFSFGIVLYEMATGRRPFTGESNVAILSSIVEESPKLVSEVNREIPIELARVVRRCLQKNPGQRYQSAKDLRNELDELREALKSGELLRARPNPDPARAPRRWWAASAAGMLVMLAAGFWLAQGQRFGGGSSSGGDALLLGNPTQVTLASGWETDPALSPDGTLVAYSSNQEGDPDIWLTGFRGGSSVHLAASPANDEKPAWFPDGSAIAFASNRGGRWNVWKVPALGGEATPLVEDARDPAISRDGTHIAFERSDEAGESRIYVAPLADTTRARRVTSGADLALQPENDPAWSPDGQTLCFSSGRSLKVVAASGGHPREITTDRQYDIEPVWSPDGRRVYFSSLRGGVAALWQVTADGGTPTRLTRGPGPERHPTVSLSGNRLAFSTFSNDNDLVIRDLGTGQERRTGTTRSEVYPFFSHDRKWLVYVHSSESGGTELWLQPIADGRFAGKPHQLTRPPGNASHPEFSADDRWVAYQRAERNRRAVWVVPAAGGTPVPLVTDAADSLHPAWSPTGDRIAFASSRSDGLQIWLAPVSNGRLAGEANRATTGPGNRTQPAWSPDGRQLAYLGDHDGATDVWVSRAASPAAARRVTSNAHAAFVKWDPAGRSLLVSGTWQDERLSIRRVDLGTGATTQFEPPLLIGHPSGYPVFDVSGDGRFVAFSRAEWAGDIWNADILRKRP
jgi:Tol biopolymer transport system component/serine/threonine protein kinase